MSASLVGSEMCIRDRALDACIGLRASANDRSGGGDSGLRAFPGIEPGPCLLYTSDAADDM
eukprot:927177-Alexandrium_andersonii.AAC.1